MMFAGTYYFDADQSTVWNLMMNPEAIAAATPGVDALIPIEGEPDAWQADATLAIPLLNGTYAGTIRLSEQNPIDSYRLTLSGTGRQSTFNGTAFISLTYDAGLEQTIVHWNAEATITGKLATVGPTVMAAAADMMSKQYFRNLAKRLLTK